MFLGRIIANRKFKVPYTFIDVTTDTDKVFSSDVPVLIVGKSFVEGIVGKNKVKVLDKTISKTSNIQWTYKKTEKRNDFEKDLKSFYNSIFDNIKKNIEYRYFDIFTVQLSCIKKFIKYVRTCSINKYIYENDKHIYIYDTRGIVYGISKDQLKYIGISVDKVNDIIKSNPNNELIESHDFLDGIKNFDEIYYPYLYFAMK